MGAGGKGILRNRTGTRFPLRSLTSQIPFLLDAKAEQLMASWGQAWNPPLGRSPAQHPLTAEDAGKRPPPRAGGWWTGLQRPHGPMSREHPLPARPSPQGPVCFEQNPSCCLLSPSLARQHRALRGGFSQRPVRPLGHCRKSWRPASQCIASGCQEVPGHRKKVLVALVLSKGTGTGGPQECPERGPWAFKPVRDSLPNIPLSPVTSSAHTPSVAPTA